MFNLRFQFTIQHCREVEAGTSEWSHFMLPCLYLARFLLSLQFRASCLGNGAAHSGLGHPISINLLRPSSTDMPTSHPNVDNPLLCFSSPEDLGVFN